MNEITIHGNVTAQPELRFSASGVPILTFSVAVNRRRRNRQTGNWSDLPAVFHRVVCFNALAENAAKSLTRGISVTVTGEFGDDSWTPEGGDKIRRIQLEASEIGISLRFATAAVTKNDRAESNGQRTLKAVADEPFEATV